MKKRTFEEDARMLKSQIRKYKEKLEESGKVIKEQNARMNKLEERCERLADALKNRNISVEDIDNIRKFKEELDTKSKEVQELEHKIGVLTKANEVEKKKAKQSFQNSTQEISDLKKQIDTLRDELNEKDKELRLSAIAISHKKISQNPPAVQRVHRIQPLNADQSSYSEISPVPHSPSKIPRYNQHAKSRGNEISAENQRRNSYSKIPVKKGQATQQKKLRSEGEMLREELKVDPQSPVPDPQTQQPLHLEQQQQQKEEEEEEADTSYDNTDFEPANTSSAAGPSEREEATTVEDGAPVSNVPQDASAQPIQEMNPTAAPPQPSESKEPQLSQQPASKPALKPSFGRRKN